MVQFLPKYSCLWERRRFDRSRFGGVIMVISLRIFRRCTFTSHSKIFNFVFYVNKKDANLNFHTLLTDT